MINLISTLDLVDLDSHRMSNFKGLENEHFFFTQLRQYAYCRCVCWMVCIVCILLEYDYSNTMRTSYARVVLLLLCIILLASINNIHTLSTTAGVVCITAS